MSYDLRILVKIEDYDGYAEIAEPYEYSHPTYNLGRMFRACMDWDYSQGDKYKCSEVIDKIERGIRELRTNRSEYEQYNPENNWGSIDGAIKALESLQKCIYEEAEHIPIEHLYMEW